MWVSWYILNHYNNYLTNNYRYHLAGACRAATSSSLNNNIKQLSKNESADNYNYEKTKNKFKAPIIAAAHALDRAKRLHEAKQINTEGY